MAAERDELARQRKKKLRLLEVFERLRTNAGSSVEPGARFIEENRPSVCGELYERDNISPIP